MLKFVFLAIIFQAFLLLLVFLEATLASGHKGGPNDINNSDFLAFPSSVHHGGLSHGHS